MKHLEFRRQFVLSPKKSEKLSSWKFKTLGDFFLYAHPDCQLKKVSENGNEICLVGYVFNPNEQLKNEEDILLDILFAKSAHQISEQLYPLVGRFVLILFKDGQYFIYHDACGLKTVYYAYFDSGFYAASQPTLITYLCSIKRGQRYNDYFESKYTNSNKEHWIPSGKSLYEDIYHLIPNHYMDVLGQKQIRFYPNRKVHKESLDVAEVKFANLLKKTMDIAGEKFDLSLAITAGFDSRVLLSACKGIADNLKFYTLQYRGLNERSTDILISNKLITGLGYAHDVIDCRTKLKKDFLEIYEENSGIPHVDDWGHIALGIYENYPQNRLAVKGNCAEIGRCYYYENGIHPKSLYYSDLVKLEYKWEDIGFISDQLKKWHEDINVITANFEYKELDLFYWEHRMGSWQAQSQLEWDIAQDVFTPFNNRELLDIILSVPSQYRCCPDYTFFTDTMEYLWPETLNIPINPKSRSEKVKRLVKNSLKKIGLYHLLVKLLK